MAISVNVTETVIDTDVTNTDVTVALTEQTTNVELTYPGPQGASAIVNVTTPITNTGTTTEPNIGIDQTLLSLARTQIVGTAVTEAAGKALTAGTADYATLAGTSSFSTNAGTATYATSAGSATTAGTADYATLAGTAVNISGTIAPTQVTGTAAILGANTFTDQQTITPSNAVGLFVKGDAASNDIFQAQINGAATNRFIINTAGRTAIGSPATVFNSAFLSVSSVFTTNPAIVVRAVASQTANLQEWQNSGGTAISYVLSSGAFVISTLNTNTIQNTATSSNARLQLPSSGSLIDTGVAANVTLRVQNTNATPTGDLTQWLNTGGTAVASINNVGGFYSTSASVFDSTLRVGAAGSYSATLNVLPTGTGVFGIVIRGRTSQTADLQQWQSSSGAVSAKVDAFGGAQFTYANIISDSATTRPLSARAAANATANIVEWQASGGTVLGGRNAVGQLWSGSTSPVTVATGGATTAASGTGTTATITTTSAHGLAVGDLVTVAGVTPTGYNATAVVTAVTSTTFSYANATTGSQTVAGTVSVPAQASITARSAGTVGLVVRAAASQVAKALSIQNSSGTQNGSWQSDGGLLFSYAQTNSGYTQLADESSGGVLRLQRLTASATSPGANLAKIYLVAGTNANTLKLVVRAGAAGAETTILDNIPT